MRVLVVDDNPDHRELIIAKIRQGLPRRGIRGGDPAVDAGRSAATRRSFRRRSDGLSPAMERRPEGSVAGARSGIPHIPVVMVTDTGSEEVAAAGMKGGLADYVLKDHLHRLPLAFKESLEKARLRRDHEEALDGCAFPKSATGSFRNSRPTTPTRTGSRPTAPSSWSGSPGVHAHHGLRSRRVGKRCAAPPGPSRRPRADRARAR